MQEGSGQDLNDNASDFFLNPTPDPQSSGSPAVPALNVGLQLSVDYPREAQPGSELKYQVFIENTTSGDIDGVLLHFPSPADLDYQDSTIEAAVSDGWLLFELDKLEANSTSSLEVVFTAPWKYTTISLQGLYAESSELDSPVFAGVSRTVLSGGTVPIGIARGLLGTENVIIEGTATMYTDGLYAGSSGTKFYLEDESGGVQVYVPGGKGKVEIPIGAYVRVEGLPQPYRGTIELVPSPDDIVVLRPPDENVAREAADISAMEAKDKSGQYVGRLVTLNGEIVRVEEFSYSYELDLSADGALLTAYVDKQTLINVETIEVGSYYQLTGILEAVDDKVQLYPRVQDDLLEIQAPTVAINAQLPINYSPAELVPLQILVANHLPEMITDVTVTLSIPQGFSAAEISEGGKQVSESIVWQLPELAGGGEQAVFNVTGVISEELDYLKLEDYSVTYTAQEEVLYGETRYAFPGDSIPVWAIQGPGFRSPYLLMEVKTSGVVTGVFQGLEGFWIQGEEDADTSTSQGLFVYKDLDELAIIPEELGVAVGDRVSVVGEVHEAHEETQLFLTEVEILSQDQSLPQAIKLTPPSDDEESAFYYEALEGMLVKVPGEMRAASPTNKYGETALVPLDFGNEHLMIGEDNGLAVRVDDGSSVTHTDQSTLMYVAVTGDILSNIEGPLGFNYGYYKIETMNPPRVVSRQRTVDALPSTREGQFRVMTWNVENLFDFWEPHPSDPDMPTVDEYNKLLEKVASTIRLAGAPAIIGLQEVENVGVLEDLAANPLLDGFDYQPVLLEGTDSRGIDVGYLVRGDVVIKDVQQLPAPEELTPRPPLLLEVEIEVGASSQTLYLINNHFLSMSGGEKATEPRRVAQAAWNAELVAQIVAEDPNAQVIVMGDLNSYYHSPPIDALRTSGLKHVLDGIPPEGRYTYIYQGIAEVLDHMLVNDNLYPFIATVDILHSNADYPLQPPGDTSVLHKSDHDPVVVTFQY